MKLSKYYSFTLREDPNEAHLNSHKLMLRAGMIRQATSGIYTWLPLGLKVLNKIKDLHEPQRLQFLEFCCFFSLIIIE